jgi:hypothetical protein
MGSNPLITERPHQTCIDFVLIALGDLSNSMKYGNLCGLWHLYRECDPELLEQFKDPMMYLSQD